MRLRATPFTPSYEGLHARIYVVTLPAASSAYFEYACVGLGREPCISTHLRPAVTGLE
jgi:hypothetical protein